MYDMFGEDLPDPPTTAAAVSPEGDHWVDLRNSEGVIQRVHVEPRAELYVPTDTYQVGAPNISDLRITRAKLKN